jgi:hypothetical protein
MAEQTPEQWIDLLISRASELREAGVLSLTLGACQATFESMPAEEPDWSKFAVDVAGQDSAMEDQMDALMNPETFGIRDGGPLPGYYANRDRALDPDGPHSDE